MVINQITYIRCSKGYQCSYNLRSSSLKLGLYCVLLKRGSLSEW